MNEHASSFSRRASRPSCCSSPSSFRSPHRSSSDDTGGGAGAVTICALSHECKKEEKESGTPKDADPYPLYLAVQLAPCKARSPIGVPPRLLPKGVIIPKAHPGPGFVRRAPRGGFAADASPHSQRAPRAPVIVPAGLIPETPGSRGDEPPPAGTASRSDRPGSPADVLHGERDRVPLFKSRRQCQRFVLRAQLRR